MELIDLECKKCGATLQVNPALEKCMCQYCGHEMLVNKGLTGFDIAKGMADYNDKNKQEVMAKILDIIRISIKKEELNKKYLFPARMYSSAGNWCIAPAIISVFLAYGIFGLFYNGHIVSGIILFVILAIGIFAYSYLYGMPKEREIKAKYKPMMEDIKEEIAELNADMLNKIDELHLKDYANRGTLITLHKYLDTGRADTLKEALNLFESEMHNAQMRAMVQSIATVQVAEYLSKYN